MIADDEFVLKRKREAHTRGSVCRSMGWAGEALAEEEGREMEKVDQGKKIVHEDLLRVRREIIS